MSGLTGKFIFWDKEESYVTGELTSPLVDGVYLMRIDPFGEVPSHGCLIALQVVWNDVIIFDSREELDSWLEWLETPTTPREPRVVSINAKKH